MIKNKFLLLAGVLAITAVSYANVVRGEFQFDDDTYIAENPLIKEPIGLIQTNILDAFALGKRLIVSLTFALNYAGGGLDVAGYHIVNILVHLMAVLSVYFFVKKTLTSAAVREAFHGGPEWAAVAVAGIFALHPIQTQAVSYIVQRAESLASLFYLLCLICLIKFVETRGGRSFGYWSAAMAFFVSGWLCKVIIVTLPLVFLVFAVFFMGRTEIKKAIAGIAPLVIAGAFLGIKKVLSFHGSGDIGFDVKGVGQPEYFYTEMRVLLTYLRLIFLPVNQNLDYDYPLYREFRDLGTACSILFWMSAAGLSFCSLRVKGYRKRHLRVMGFGMIWFLLILAPTSSVIPVKDVIFEHRVYLAMLGIVIASAACADLMLRSWIEKRGKAGTGFIMVPFIVLLFLTLAFATYTRNAVWRTKRSMWEDVVKKSPLNARGHYNLGNEYKAEGRLFEAVKHFKTALRLDPSKVKVHNNLGNCYYLMRDYPSAIGRYRRAIGLDPENAESYYNAAIALEGLGREAEAVSYYRTFIKKAPKGYAELVELIEKKLLRIGAEGAR